MLYIPPRARDREGYGRVRDDLVRNRIERGRLHALEDALSPLAIMRRTRANMSIGGLCLYMLPAFHHAQK